MSDAPVEPELRRRSSSVRLRFFDRLAAGGALGGAWTMVLLLGLLLIVVTRGGWQAIRQFGPSFIWTTGWRTTITTAHPDYYFGGWAAICGTIRTSIIGLAIAVPVSLGAGIFLVRIAPRVRIPIPKLSGGFIWISPRYVVMTAGFLIELLAAIPSIAFGLWAREIMVPFLQDNLQPKISAATAHIRVLSGWFENTFSGQNTFAAGIILAVMITPIITAIIRDVLLVAPPELEQGALGLGATWWQATRLVLGVCKLGILGAIILGFARALGETMAVTLIIGGDAAHVNTSLFDSGQTIASLLALQFGSPTSDMHLSALYYAAFLLLIMTTLINTLARAMVMAVAARNRRR